MRAPDETKKGLECCAASYADCHKECPYKPDCDGSQILKDAFALIQQLQAKNAELLETIMWMEAERDDLKRAVYQLEADNDRLTDEVCNAYNIQNEQLVKIKQLEAERDAAVKAIEFHKSCIDCKHSTIIPDGDGIWIDCPKRDGRCRGLNLWGWRGAQKEGTA